MAYVDDEDLLAVVAEVERTGNKALAARNLGMSRETVRDQYQQAVRRNLTGEALGGHMPEGFELTKITSLVKRADGTSMEWQHKTRITAQQDNLEALVTYLNENLEPVKLIEAPAYVLADQCTQYPIVDFHLGQYSWGKETRESYDLDIARDTYKATVTKLVARTPASHTALVVGYGDFFHADSNLALTPGHGNALDTDGRNGKVINLGAELVIWTIELALQKHAIVVVRMLAGNHDPRGGDLLTLAVRMRFLDNPRVIVDRDPGYFWFYQWGTTMLAGIHGHETKIEQMPGVMAAYEPKMWGNTTFRYAYAGHWHRRIKGRDADEKGGAIWEVFQAITAKDGWNRGKGHSSGRSMVAITYSLTEGEIDRKTQPIL